MTDKIPTPNSGPRVTMEDCENQVMAEDYHVFRGTMLTVCCITMNNGFTVTGESACAAPENFNENLGREIARKKAIDKIWLLLGYDLKQRLYQIANPFNVPKP